MIIYHKESLIFPIGYFSFSIAPLPVSSISLANHLFSFREYLSSLDLFHCKVFFSIVLPVESIRHQKILLHECILSQVYFQSRVSPLNSIYPLSLFSFQKSFLAYFSSPTFSRAYNFYLQNLLPVEYFPCIFPFPRRIVFYSHFFSFKVNSCYIHTHLFISHE